MRQTQPAEGLLTPREVAAKLSLSVSSVQRLAREGRLPAFRLGLPGGVPALRPSRVERWYAPEDGAPCGRDYVGDEAMSAGLAAMSDPQHYKRFEAEVCCSGCSGAPGGCKLCAEPEPPRLSLDAWEVRAEAREEEAASALGENRGKATTQSASSATWRKSPGRRRSEGG